jgi:two-component system, chemotaxis family, CheB/CheR fusion protein
MSDEKTDSSLRKTMSEGPKPKTSPDEAQGHGSFPIVGIGASAGGLEALTQLFSKIPKDTGMAFLVVQHLDPHHESRLPELLSRLTSVRVTEAAHGERVEPNHLYVIPPNRKMALAKGVLHLSPRGEERAPHLAIDYLFRSLAEDQQGRAVAVVLSGTGSDGSQGLCEIKAVSGITFAQDEKTAVHAGMPRSAIDSGCVDFVLPPGDMALRLAEIGRHPYLRSVSPPPDTEASAEESFRNILATVHTETGVDFSLYRDTTIRRRILRRMALCTQRSLGEYARQLQRDRKEVRALYHDLVINVTSFFRNPEVFEALKKEALPELAGVKSPNAPFRAWVPGCSTGQEAYSLAMTLQEFFDQQPTRPPVQIFATDLVDIPQLERARAGVYPEGIESEVTPERLRRFFHREDSFYRIDKSIRDMVVFAQHNVTSDPPFSNLDLISCRNVLIYMSSPLQKRVLPAFHYALKQPGFLVLGSAESVGDHTDLFEAKDPAHRIFAKKAALSRQAMVFPAPDYHTPFVTVRRGSPLATPLRDSEQEADRIVMGRYAPPGVLVDESFSILQVRGRISSFLELPPGEPTVDVLKMAREGLFLELRNALTEAKLHDRAVRRDQIRIRSNGEVRHASLEVIPLHPPSGGKSFLVLFHDAPPETAEAPSASTPSEPETSTAKGILQLRQELSSTREYLQSMIEQQDAVNEELRSANQEIISSNEELRSTNEELETSREELQSTNEELTTVNEQVQRRTHQMDRLNNDLINLLSSANLPMIMVGLDHRIRRFTPAAEKLMNLIAADVGRPLEDIRPANLIPDLTAAITEVIDKVRTVEHQVQDRQGRWHVLRVHPYRTTDNRIDGAVLVLVDVDQIRRDQEELRRRAALIELSRDAVIIRNAENEVTFWNHGAQEMYGWSAEEARGKPLDELLGTSPTAWAELNGQLDLSGSWEGELHQKRQDGSSVIVHCREVLVRDERGARQAVLAIKRDITEHLKTLDALKEAGRRKDEFLAMLAHELRNPLAPILNAAEILRLAGDNPAQVRRAQEMLSRQAKNLARIVDDLLDMTRIVEKKIELRKEQVALQSVVQAAVETCRSLVDDCGHRLSVELPAEPIYLHADPMRLSQVLVNLLTNAAKYTESGGQIWLTAERSNHDSREGCGTPEMREVIIRVRDTGIGIPAELLPRVFEMFTQGPRSTKQGRGGLGVGLTLVRSVVQMHGGSVDVDSAGPDRGTEFVVRLPLSEGGAPGKPKGSNAWKAPGSAPKRILVVDDNPDQVKSLGCLLELMGHEVHLADSAEAALEDVSDFDPQVALVDLGLPGMDGYELARRIRRDPRLRGIQLVAQTGWGQREDFRRSHEAGFDHHLVKPITTAALQKVLGEGSPRNKREATPPPRGG